MLGSSGRQMCCQHSRVDSDRFGAVVRLVDAHKTVGQLKHVVSQRDDDELSITPYVSKLNQEHGQWMVGHEMHDQTQDIQPIAFTHVHLRILGAFLDIVGNN